MAAINSTEYIDKQTKRCYNENTRGTPVTALPPYGLRTNRTVCETWAVSSFCFYAKRQGS